MTEGYAAARERAAFIERSNRVRMEFAGAKPAETLNGIFTNDVSLLKPGAGHYAAALTNKGKVIADVRVFARDGRFVVDTSAAAGPAFVAMIRKYVNPRLATYRDISATVGTVGVFGPTASAVMASASGIAADLLESLSPYGQVPLASGDGFIARVPDLGVAGFDLFAPTEAIATIIEQLRAAGVTELMAAGAEVLRVEAGRPLYGTDMDENVLAQEAALDRDDLGAISFNKGCYTGQETVARVHFRGHVNRTLRGLRLAGPVASASTLHTGDGTEVGRLRSVIESPRFGWIALGYVRREVPEGTALTVRSGDAESGAVVSALPFA